jgi:hypothetical protein
MGAAFNGTIGEQAQMEQLVLVTADRSLGQYQVDLLDAGL